jgi:hypothetical protein
MFGAFDNIADPYRHTDPCPVARFYAAVETVRKAAL